MNTAQVKEVLPHRASINKCADRAGTVRCAGFLFCGRRRRYTIQYPFASADLESMETKNNSGSISPEFEKILRHPQYWGALLGAAAMAGDRITGIIPRPFAGDAGAFCRTARRVPRRRALINLSLCFPQRSEAERGDCR